MEEASASISIFKTSLTPDCMAGRSNQLLAERHCLAGLGDYSKVFISENNHQFPIRSSSFGPFSFIYIQTPSIINSLPRVDRRYRPEWGMSESLFVPHLPVTCPAYCAGCTYFVRALERSFPGLVPRNEYRLRPPATGACGTSGTSSPSDTSDAAEKGLFLPLFRETTHRSAPLNRQSTTAFTVGSSINPSCPDVLSGFVPTCLDVFYGVRLDKTNTPGLLPPILNHQ